MAGVDGEELAIDDAFVLAVRADRVAVRERQENGLESTESLHIADCTAVIDETIFEIVISFGEFCLQHDFGMSI